MDQRSDLPDSQAASWSAADAAKAKERRGKIMFFVVIVYFIVSIKIFYFILNEMEMNKKSLYILVLSKMRCGLSFQFWCIMSPLSGSWCLSDCFRIV